MRKKLHTVLEFTYILIRINMCLLNRENCVLIKHSLVNISKSTRANQKLPTEAHGGLLNFHQAESSQTDFCSRQNTMHQLFHYFSTKRTTGNRDLDSPLIENLCLYLYKHILLIQKYSRKADMIPATIITTITTATSMLGNPLESRLTFKGTDAIGEAIGDKY